MPVAIRTGGDTPVRHLAGKVHGAGGIVERVEIVVDWEGRNGSRKFKWFPQGEERVVRVHGGSFVVGRVVF